MTDRIELVNIIAEKAEYYSYTSRPNVKAMMEAKYLLHEEPYNFDEILNEVMELIDRQQDEEKEWEPKMFDLAR